MDVFVDKDRALPTFLLVREFIKHILIESKVLSKCAFCAVRTSQMIRVSLKRVSELYRGRPSNLLLFLPCFYTRSQRRPLFTCTR